MDTKTATLGFAALAQETRLKAFRLLVTCGAEGMAAGDIARAMNVPQNTMSSHLASMVNAGLLKSNRHSRSVIYSVDLAGTQALLRFLIEECCGGRPDTCISLIDEVLPNERFGACG